MSPLHGERGPLRLVAELSSLRRDRRRRRRHAARDPRPVVRRRAAVTVKLPASLSERIRAIRIRDDRGRGGPHRRCGSCRQVRSSRDPDPVIRRRSAVAIELPAPLGVHNAIRRDRRGRCRRRRNSCRRNHDCRRRGRRSRGHDHGARRRCLNFLAPVYAAAERREQHRRHQHRSSDASIHILPSMLLTIFTCTFTRGIFCAMRGANPGGGTHRDCVHLEMRAAGNPVYGGATLQC